MLFRISSLALLGGAVAYYVINMHAFVSLDERLFAEEEKLGDVESLIERDSNSSEANMTALLKINREHRKVLEQLEEESAGANDELSFLLPKINNLNEELNSSQRELDQENGQINQIKAEASAEKDKLPLLSTRKDESLAKLEEVVQMHQVAEENWRRLDQNYSSLNRVRQAALESYNNAKRPLLEEIIRPFEVFYGDSIEVEIDNISEREKGFFAKFGLEQGIRSGFVFIVQSDDEWNDMPDFLICSLAEKKYSFLKILNGNEGKLPSYFRPGKKLTLIRSADLSNANGSSELDDKKILPHTDLQGSGK